jgi:hypothetical protein
MTTEEDQGIATQFEGLTIRFVAGTDPTYLHLQRNTQLHSTGRVLHLCYIGRLDGKDLLVTAPIGSVLHSFGMPSQAHQGL